MPRSGTSLAEQILASHPAGGRRRGSALLGAAPSASTPAGRGDTPRAGLRGSWRADYLARLGALAGGAARVIDKMPANFLYARADSRGVPARAHHPHAARSARHLPVDLFPALRNMRHRTRNDLGDLAHYYAEYLRIMAHWRTVLPPRTCSKCRTRAGRRSGRLDAAGCWSSSGCRGIPAAWIFTSTERMVITASRWQVRQKISTQPRSGAGATMRNTSRRCAALRSRRRRTLPGLSADAGGEQPLLVGRVAHPRRIAQGDPALARRPCSGCAIRKSRRSRLHSGGS